MGDQEILKAMGRRMTARRRQLGMTQEELADRMDVSPQMISYAEQGRKAIRPENLIRMCQALEVSADHILTGSSPTGSDRLYARLRALRPEQLALVEQVIECCLKLSGAEEG